MNNKDKKWFLLKGYNSAGYFSSREIFFNGNLKYISFYDKNNNLIRYIEVTYPDGKIIKEQNDFLQNILNNQSYIEEFYVTDIEEFSEKMILKKKEEEKKNK